MLELAKSIGIEKPLLKWAVNGGSLFGQLVNGRSKEEWVSVRSKNDIIIVASRIPLERAPNKNSLYLLDALLPWWGLPDLIKLVKRKQQNELVWFGLLLGSDVEDAFKWALSRVKKLSPLLNDALFLISRGLETKSKALHELIPFFWGLSAREDFAELSGEKVSSKTKAVVNLQNGLTEFISMPCKPMSKISFSSALYELEIETPLLLPLSLPLSIASSKESVVGKAMYRLEGKRWSILWLSTFWFPSSSKKEIKQAAKHLSEIFSAEALLAQKKVLSFFENPTSWKRPLIWHEKQFDDLSFKFEKQNIIRFLDFLPA